MEWVRPHLSSDPKKFQVILDPRLEGKYSLKAAQKLATVASRCLVRAPKSRPKMSEVLEMVNRIMETTDMGSPELPLHNVDSKEDYFAESKRESLMRRLVDPFIGENCCFNWLIGRPKIVNPCWSKLRSILGIGTVASFDHVMALSCDSDASFLFCSCDGKSALCILAEEWKCKVAYGWQFELLGLASWRRLAPSEE